MDRLVNFAIKISNLGVLLSVALTPIAWAEQNPQSAQSSANQNNGSTSIANGVYLYGESAEPEQIGQEYFVFEIQQDRVVGAVYYPRSEFSCVYGSLEPQEMSLSVVHPYGGQTSSYSIDVDTSTTVANAGDRLITDFKLQGYKQIETVSSNDRRMLNTCIEEAQSD